MTRNDNRNIPISLNQILDIYLGIRHLIFKNLICRPFIGFDIIKGYEVDTCCSVM